ADSSPIEGERGSPRCGIDSNLSDRVYISPILRPMNNTAANDPTTAFWETLRDFVAQAFTLFGAPHEIAQFGVRLRDEHKLFLHSLRQCETLLRKLFFIEARARALAPSLAATPPPARGRLGGGQRTRRTHEQDPENSETWRVCFRVSAPACGGSGSRA